MQRNVFIVEDELVLRKALCRSLSRAGYAVRSASSVAAFLAMVGDETNPEETLIVDVGLPDGDGLDAWKAARCHRSDLRAIVVTARDLPDVRERAREAGAQAFLSKPIDLPHLLDVLERQFTHSSVAQA